jgi:hypothetical protein
VEGVENSCRGRYRGEKKGEEGMTVQTII